MVEPVRGSASWTRDGTPGDAMRAIEAYARNRDCRVKKRGSQLTLHFGSRLISRLAGFTAGRIPYTVQVSVTAGHGLVTELTADAYSDPGPFIVYRPESADGIYEHFISETLGELRHL